MKRAPLRLGDVGVAATYLAVPVGEFDSEASHLRDACKSVSGLTGLEVVYVLGQADLFVQLLLKDFRALTELASPGPASSALVFNWVLAARYLSKRDEDKADGSVLQQTGTSALAEARSASETLTGEPVEDQAPAQAEGHLEQSHGELDPPNADRPFAAGRLRKGEGWSTDFRFNTHLRVRRSIYRHAHQGALEVENELVGAIRDLAKAHELTVEVGIGLGWSDIVVDGGFSGAPDRLARFLAELHELSAPTSGPGSDQEQPSATPLFLRTLTILGYPAEKGPPRTSGLNWLLLVRSQPGGLRSASELLQARGASEQRLTDGKWDLVVTGLQNTCDDILARHRDLAEGSGTREIIQRLETHLVFPEAQASLQSLSRPGRNSIDMLLRPAASQPCGCSQYAPPPELLGILQAQSPILGGELRHSLGNIVSLSLLSLRDSTNCCDLLPAIRACHLALLVPLQALQRSSPNLLNGTPSEQQEAYEDSRRSYERLDLISTYTERILRQRTVGSFEEFLGHTDRALTYRGSAQKFQFLADMLMSEFSTRLLPPGPGGRSFATVHDPSDTASSLAGTGIVRMPVRHLFTLPLALPDLWHEVGAHEFLLALTRGETHPRSRQEDVHTMMADHFGDLAVYLGFREDEERFIVSFFSDQLDLLRRHTLPEEERKQALRWAVFRAYWVLEFSACRADQRLFRERTDSVWRGENVPRLVSGLHAKIVAWIYGSARYKDAERPPSRVWHAVLRLALQEEVYSLFHSEQEKMREATYAHPTWQPPDPGHLLAGRLMVPDRACGQTNNDMLAALYWHLKQRNLRGEKTEGFRPQAAACRSAVLSFYSGIGI